MHNAMRQALGQPRSAAGFEKLDPEIKRYLDRVLALLATTPADKALLAQILSIGEAVDRSALIAKLSDQNLQGTLTALLPEIEPSWLNIAQLGMLFDHYRRHRGPRAYFLQSEALKSR